jgi:hypothetical protein
MGTIYRIEQTLDYNAGDIASDKMEASTIIQLWVQKVALGVARERGHDVHDVDFRMSPAWFSCVMKALTDHTRFVLVESAMGVNTFQERKSGTLKISAIVEAALLFLGGAGMAGRFAGLAALLQQTSLPGVENFATLWWNKQTFSDSKSNFMFGPTEPTIDGHTRFGLLYTHYTYKFEAWRAIFIESVYESFDFTANMAGIKFDMSVWRQWESDVRRRLGVAIQEGIDEAPLGKALTEGSILKTESRVMRYSIESAPIFLE